MKLTWPLRTPANKKVQKSFNENHQQKSTNISNKIWWFGYIYKKSRKSTHGASLEATHKSDSASIFFWWLHTHNVFFSLRQHTMINQKSSTRGDEMVALTMLQSATASVMMVPELPAAACSRAYDMQGGATRTRRSPVSTPLYTCRRTCVARRPHARITAVRTDVSLTWSTKNKKLWENGTTFIGV